MKEKKRGCAVFLLTFAGVLVLAAALIYFLLPGLRKPNNLGIKTSQEAYQNAINKLEYKKDKAPLKGSNEDYSYVYGSPRRIEAILTSEEITSFFNVNRPSYYALKNVQVRINDDNTIEAAATLDTDYLFESVLGGRYNREDAGKALPMLGFLPGKLNFYCKMDGKIAGNRLEEFEVKKASVMGVPVPGKVINNSGNKAFISDTIGSYLDRVSEKTGAGYELIEIRDGKLAVKGKMPSSLSRAASGGKP